MIIYIAAFDQPRLAVQYYPCIHLYYVVLNAQLPPENPEEISTIVFPENGDTQVTIPGSAIIYQRNTEGMVISLWNIYVSMHNGAWFVLATLKLVKSVLSGL